MRTITVFIIGCVVSGAPAWSQTPPDDARAAVRRPSNANDPASDATLGARPGAPAPPRSPASPASPAPASPASARPDQFGDADVAAALERRFAQAAKRLGDGIKLTVQDGIATLTGSVPSLRAADHAAELARATRGIRAVVDRLTVTPSGRSDDSIRSDLDTALLMDPVTESFKIEAVVRNGAVTLTGVVHSYAEKHVATEVARGVRGVTAVRNDLTVQYRSKRSNVEIESEVRRRLASDVLLRGRALDARVSSDGEVTVTGTVASLAEKHRAERLAGVLNTSGVHVDQIAVDPRLVDAAARPISDRDIRQAILDAFVSDPRVLSMNPKVTVRDGSVTLRGRVRNRDALRAAERDARFAAGVRDVVNLMSVEPAARRKDAEVAADVRSALDRDIWLTDDRISVSCRDGAVTLTGEVDGRFEFDLADSVVSRVNGVKQVINLLGYESYVWVVRPAERVSVKVDPARDEEIRKNIEWEMIWSPFVDADQVRTTVRGGVATLSGIVDSASERQAAIVNAREGGAYSVVDRLTVR